MSDICCHRKMVRMIQDIAGVAREPLVQVAYPKDQDTDWLMTRVALIQGQPGARRYIGRRTVPFMMNLGCLLWLDVSIQC